MNSKKHSRLRRLQTDRKCQRIFNRMADYIWSLHGEEITKVYADNLIFGTPINLQDIIGSSVLGVR